MNAEQVTRQAVVEPLTEIGRWADQFKADEIDALRFTVLVGRLLETLAERAYGIEYQR
jgi:hypothetical protein